MFQVFLFAALSLEKDRHLNHPFQKMANLTVLFLLGISRTFLLPNPASWIYTSFAQLDSCICGRPGRCAMAHSSPKCLWPRSWPCPFPSSTGVLLTRDSPLVPVKLKKKKKRGIYQQQHVLANLSLFYQLLILFYRKSRGKNQLCMQTAFQLRGP